MTTFTYPPKVTSSLRKAFVLLLLLFCAPEVNAQWSKIKPAYGGLSANDGAATFSIAGKGYLVCGSTSRNMYSYDTTADQWTQVSGTVPASVGRVFAMSFVVNGKGYIVGGDTSGVGIATVWMYDPVQNSWTRKNDFPTGVRDAGFGFAINNYGYVGGGYNGSQLLSDIWKYDPANDSWTQQPGSLPIGLLFPTSFVADNKGYVLSGGQAPSGVNETKKMWRFDPVTGNWTVMQDFPGVGRQAAFAFSNNSYGYVGGGQSGFTTIYTDMYRYSVANDSWTQVQSAPLFGTAWSSAFVIGNTAYAGLGAAFTATGLVGNDSFYRYRMSPVTATGITVNTGNSMKWSLYPNPAASMLHLEGTVGLTAKAVIYDGLGKVVKSIDDVSARQINISDLANGIYTLQLISKEGTSSHQFVRKE